MHKSLGWVVESRWRVEWRTCSNLFKTSRAKRSVSMSPPVSTCSSEETAWELATSCSTSVSPENAASAPESRQKVKAPRKGSNLTQHHWTSVHRNIHARGRVERMDGWGTKAGKRREVSGDQECGSRTQQPFQGRANTGMNRTCSAHASLAAIDRDGAVGALCKLWRRSSLHAAVTQRGNPVSTHDNCKEAAPQRTQKWKVERNKQLARGEDIALRWCAAVCHCAVKIFRGA